MTTAQEIERMLIDAAKAKDELKETISAARVARKDLLDAQKQHRQKITDLITAEITGQVGALADQTRADMRASIDAEVARVVAEWRRALRLDA